MATKLPPVSRELIDYLKANGFGTANYAPNAPVHDVSEFNCKIGENRVITHLASIADEQNARN